MSKISYKVMAVIIIGISILAAEYFYFSNKIYTIEVVEEGLKLTATGRPGKQAKLVVGISILAAINIVAILGWLVHRSQQRVVCEGERDMRKTFSKR